jgi:hypothetical protein
MLITYSTISFLAFPSFFPTTSFTPWISSSRIPMAGAEQERESGTVYENDT